MQIKTVVPVILAVTTFGCAELPSGPGSPECLDTGDCRRYVRTSPSNTVEFYKGALELKDYRSADELLAEDFTFVPRDDEAADFSHIAWNRETEMTVLERMFDARYSGGRIAFSIEFDYELIDETDNGDGSVSVEIEALVVVLSGPATGWVADTALTLVLRPDPDDAGLWQLSAATELPHDAEPTSLDPATWASIRAYYASPPRLRPLGSFW